MENNLTIHLVEKIKNILIGFDMGLPFGIIDYSWDWQVGFWWASISAISIFNLLLWGKSADWIRREVSNNSTDDSYYMKVQLLLSLIYVTISAFRSIIPRADVQKIVLWNTYLSSIFVGRSVATIAELCFAFQIAYFLKYLSKKYDSLPVSILSNIVFPILFIAEFFSWYSVLSTNYIGNTIEESLWCLSGVVLLIVAMLLISKTKGIERFYFIAMGVFALSFVSFMILVDIPMYYNRYLEDTVSGKSYPDLMSGFINTNQNWYVTHKYTDWNGELAWMFLYFSVAVWVSIHMIRVPVYLKQIERKEYMLFNLKIFQKESSFP